VGLPSQLGGGEELSLPGRIARVDRHAGSGRNLVTVAFEEIGDEARDLLDAILEGKAIGTVVTRLGENLSEETAPTTIKRQPAPEPAQEEDLEPAAVLDGPPHARHNRRVIYTRKVTALLGGGEYTILGRDLSIAGMRSEPIPEFPIGMKLELAIYGPSGAEPVLVQAVVSRDDGPLGTVFRFESMARGDRPRLEAIIARKPEIRWLANGEEDKPVVVSRGRIRREPS
jgi:hypothetical protein